MKRPDITDPTARRAPWVRSVLFGMWTALAFVGCRSPATQFLVTVDTDLPPSIPMSLTATVVDSQGHSGLSRFGTRGPGDAGVHLPATFGITPGDGRNDGTVRLTITASLAPTTPGAPYLTLSRRFDLTFAPGITQSTRVFLSRACSAIVTGCVGVPAPQCTLSARCEETGLTCDDNGQCVMPPRVINEGDASMDACTPRCADRICGDDGCRGSCGSCGGAQTCDSLSGRCVNNCGALGAACCAGGTCMNAGAICTSGICVTPPPCGHSGQMCCSMSTCVDGTVCNGGTCGAPICGQAGQSCCGSICNDPSTTCSGGTCVPCGAPRQACCGGTTCSSPAYCSGGTCWGAPTLNEVSSEGPGCVDLGIPHASVQWTVHGRPGATGRKFVQQVSCALPEGVPSDGCFTLGADGTFTGMISNPAITDCTLGVLGRWQSYVVVDGVRSAVSNTVYSDSLCTGLETCSSASTYCPSTASAVGISCP